MLKCLIRGHIYGHYYQLQPCWRELNFSSLELRDLHWRDHFWGWWWWRGSHQQHLVLNKTVFDGSLRSVKADSFQIKLWSKAVTSLWVVGGKTLVEGVLRRLHPLLFQLLLQLRQPHVGVLLLKARHVGLLIGGECCFHPPLRVVFHVLGSRAGQRQGTMIHWLIFTSFMALRNQIKLTPE